MRVKPSISAASPVVTHSAEYSLSVACRTPRFGEGFPTALKMRTNAPSFDMQINNSGSGVYTSLFQDSPFAVSGTGLQAHLEQLQADSKVFVSQGNQPATLIQSARLTAAAYGPFSALRTHHNDWGKSVLPSAQREWDGYRGMGSPGIGPIDHSDYRLSNHHHAGPERLHAWHGDDYDEPRADGADPRSRPGAVPAVAGLLRP